MTWRPLTLCEIRMLEMTLFASRFTSSMPLSTEKQWDLQSKKKKNPSCVEMHHDIKI